MCLVGSVCCWVAVSSRRKYTSMEVMAPVSLMVHTNTCWSVCILLWCGLMVLPVCARYHSAVCVCTPGSYIYAWPPVYNGCNQECEWYLCCGKKNVIVLVISFNLFSVCVSIFLCVCARARVGQPSSKNIISRWMSPPSGNKMHTQLVACVCVCVLFFVCLFFSTIPPVVSGQIWVKLSSKYI